ncbi:transposase, partial [Acidiphilium sp.]|uniref:transposase n=1 Tax=Acidiphilium sp. TaxID=527 RepID=UPI003D039E39
MEQNSTAKPEASLFDGAAWFDPIETGVRDRIRGFIETMLEEELTAALGRKRYRRGGEGASGYRHGVRHRQILGSFGPLDITVPRGRIPKPEGGTAEWRSAALPRYARMTRQAE